MSPTGGSGTALATNRAGPARMTHGESREQLETREPAAERGHLLTAISNAIVGIYKRHHGKGPTKARSYYLDDLVICTLSGGMTRAEQTLAMNGHADTVCRQRQVLHAATRDEFVNAIEQLVGRRVLASMSTTNANLDISVDIFILEPEPVPSAA